ncbi:MAG TPA: twin-arginine translocation signal domain-containing protein, partial [Verrucomicrobia bacterium]|nr:twin-arginine translocation signal domain-containing protein [Verrucomicrobiota bacterium]
MNTEQFLTRLNRRSFLNNVSLGVGSLALTSMLGPHGLAKPAKRLSFGVINPLHFA